MNLYGSKGFDGTTYTDVVPALSQAHADYDALVDNYDRGLETKGRTVPLYYRPLEYVGRGFVSNVGAAVETLFRHRAPKARSGALSELMPKSKTQKSKKTKPTEKKTPKRVRYFRRRGAATINGRVKSRKMGKRLQRSMPAFPPLSYATNRPSGPKISFHPGRNPGCFRIKMHFRVGQIATNSLNVPIFSNMGGTTTNDDYVIPVNPASNYYFPPYVYNLVRCFLYFYINSISLHIYPRVNTSNNAVVTIGYVKDPVWPSLTGQLDGSQNCQLTESNITSLEASCTEVLYRDCVVVANVDTKNKFNVGLSNPITQINYTPADSMSPADFRQQYAGMFVVAGTRNGTDPVSTTYADVYLNLDMDLCDFNTSINHPANLSSREKKRDLECEDLLLHPDPDFDNFIDTDVKFRVAKIPLKPKSASNKS